MLDNRIDRVTIRNYRSLKDVTVELDDLTVLVGLNGSGKSNFLDALQFISHSFRAGLETTIMNRGIWDFLPYSSHDTFEIELDLTIQQIPAHIRFVIGKYHIQREYYAYGGDFLEIEDENVINTSIPLALAPQPKNFALPLIGGLPQIAPLYRFLIDLSVYNINPSTFKIVQSRAFAPNLLEDGSNLEETINNLGAHDLKELNQSLSVMFPSIPAIGGLDISKSSPFGFSLKIRHFNQDIYLEQESDGIIKAIAILATLYQPFRSTIAIEEPDNLLHPPAIAVLADELIAASKREQIIITTHSPDLIAALPVESLRVVQMVEGSTQISRLDPSQIQAVNQQIFNAGDILRIEGLKGEYHL